MITKQGVHENHHAEEDLRPAVNMMHISTKMYVGSEEVRRGPLCCRAAKLCNGRQLFKLRLLRQQAKLHVLISDSALWLMRALAGKLESAQRPSIKGAEGKTGINPTALVPLDSSEWPRSAKDRSSVGQGYQQAQP